MSQTTGRNPVATGKEVGRQRVCPLRLPRVRPSRQAEIRPAGLARLLWAVVLIFVLEPATVQAESGAVCRLYFLGGQSNMEGYGRLDELPADQRGEVAGVWIFTGRMVADSEAGGGVGRWEPLQPGHGTGFVTDGASNTRSDRFGPELSFGRQMARLHPGECIAIVKYSRGGSSLESGASGFGTWDPDFAEGNRVNQYDHALAALRNALSRPDVDGDGAVDVLKPAGIIWMQGEADAYHSRESAAAYRGNLQRLMELLRAALRVDDLPVVIGRITDSGHDADGLMMDHIAVVQQAQASYTAADRCATLVGVTDELGYSDDWHYDTAGYLRLGQAFAEAAAALETACPD